MRFAITEIEFSEFFTNIAYRNTQYMRNSKQNMKPQDIVLLLKIVSLNNTSWNQSTVAEELGISQAEISESVARSKNSGLLDSKGKTVMKYALSEFLQYGIRYAFPQKPGAVVRGVPTAHSASPLNQKIQSDEKYVWAYAKGNTRGQSIEPLYSSVPEAALKDEKLYELLAITDAIRVGRTREKEIAVEYLKKYLEIA